MNLRLDLLKKLLLLLIASFAIFILPVCVSASTTFPSIYIKTPHSPFLDKDTWQTGSISLTDSEFSFEATQARVRGRGNDTWVSYPEKRPLRFRFSEAQAMMGSDYAATDWILLANHNDGSLLRNYTAFQFANEMGTMGYKQSTHNVHLYVNGKYMGVYMLTDERDVNEGRLDIKWDEEPEKSGFFLELDARAVSEGVENETYILVNGLAYDIRFPDSSELTAEHITYVKDYIQSVNDVIHGQNFEEICKLIDLETFVDFYIVQEIFKNADVHSLSVFMYIDKTDDQRRLFMGPVWDFDTAAGNKWDQPLGHSPQDLYVAIYNDWYRHLMSNPEFVSAVANRWNEIKDVEIAKVLEQVRVLKADYKDEFERNFTRHPFADLPVSTKPQQVLEIDNFVGQVDYLTDWLELRINWLDDCFNNRLANYSPWQPFIDKLISELPAPINVVINNEEKQLASPAVLLKSRTLITVQDLTNLFDMEMQYDPKAKEFILVKDDLSISHIAGTANFSVNGSVEEAAFNSITLTEHTYVPLYVFINALGYSAEWESDTFTVIVR